METKNNENLQRIAFDDCCRAQRDWNTMHDGDQDAQIDAWIRGYKTSQAEIFMWLKGMAKIAEDEDGIDHHQVNKFIDWIQK